MTTAAERRTLAPAVRITFDGREGAWAVIGRGLRTFDRSRPSMALGFLEDDLGGGVRAARVRSIVWGSCTNTNGLTSCPTCSCRGETEKQLLENSWNSRGYHASKWRQTGSLF